MSEKGPPTAAIAVQQLPPVHACASIRCGGGEEAAGAAPTLRNAAHPQLFLAARSFSDVGPYNAAIKEALRAGCAPEDGEARAVNLQDIVFFQQYNTVYREVEGGGKGGHYAGSGGDDRSVGKGGAGSWSLRLDPEVKRKRRVAGYRAISLEGKVKSSMRRSFKWFKYKCAAWMAGHAAAPPSEGAAAAALG